MLKRQISPNQNKDGGRAQLKRSKHNSGTKLKIFFYPASDKCDDDDDKWWYFYSYIYNLVFSVFYWPINVKKTNGILFVLIEGLNLGLYCLKIYNMAVDMFCKTVVLYNPLSNLVCNECVVHLNSSVICREYPPGEVMLVKPALF